ncbi:MAG: fatty acid desaturase [bacterium]|nr:fatty acid desaturase [bacterium]
MKAKHLNLPEDTALFNSILKEIEQKLPLKKSEANQYFIIKGAVYAVLTAFAYIGIYTIENPFLFVLDYIIFGLLTVMLCFNFAHDFSHHTIFKKPFWDNLFFEFIYTLVGAHPAAWKGRHINAHHFAPNVEHFDTDLAITSLIRLIPGSQWKWYHRYQFIYGPIAYTTYSLYWVLIKDFIVFIKKKHAYTGSKFIYGLKFWVLKAFYITYLLILPLIFSHQVMTWVLVGFIAMHLVQSLYTLLTFFITHHIDGSLYPKADESGNINTSWVMNQIKSSNNFHPFSQLANSIFGGVNSHIAHHLFPHISHYHYPKVNTILFRHLRQHGIEPSVTSFGGGVYSHLNLLKKMGVKGT